MISISRKISDFLYRRTMRDYKLFVLIILLVGGILRTEAQTRKELETERMQVISQIELTDELIAKSQNERKGSIQTLNTLEAQIQQRNKLLQNIKSSISQSEIEIEDNQLKIDSLNNRLAGIQKQHNAIVRSQYKQQLVRPTWINILSAQSLNEAYLRWQYYRQSQQYRKAKVEEINKLQKQIVNRNESIRLAALDNAQLIAEQQQQNSQLQERITEQEKLLNNLKKDEAILKTQLATIKASREILNRAIENQLLGKSAINSTSNNETISPENIAYPVTNGYVIPDAEILDAMDDKTCRIQLAKEAKVIAIADGEVISVQTLEGYGKMLILRHGSHYSVYAHMSNINLAPGVQVMKNQILGNAEEDLLYFELWHDKTRLDPKKWIQ